MPSVTFITPTGQQIVTSPIEGTLMEAALEKAVSGIEADCGGVGSCGTCHVHVAAAWTELVGAASGFERDVLDLHPHATACSRLACQITLSPELDGLVVTVPGRV